VKSIENLSRKFLKEEVTRKKKKNFSVEWTITSGLDSVASSYGQMAGLSERNAVYRVVARCLSSW
jgi:hypothetical protein